MQTTQLFLIHLYIIIVFTVDESESFEPHQQFKESRPFQLDGSRIREADVSPFP